MLKETKQGRRPAEVSRQCAFFFFFLNPMQTVWVSREGALGLPYGKLSSPIIIRIMNIYTVLNTCQTRHYNNVLHPDDFTHLI